MVSDLLIYFTILLLLLSVLVFGVNFSKEAIILLFFKILLLRTMYGDEY